MSDPTTSNLRVITAEQASFVEAKTKELFDYTIQCLDRARSEGNTVLQWLFGAITGGMAALGAVWVKGYFPLVIGFGVVVIAATYAARKLVQAMRSRETQPPGNFVRALEPMFDDTDPRMRWREATGLDSRIDKNLDEVASLTASVDAARKEFATLPLWFAGGVLLVYGLKALLWIMQHISCGA